MHRAFRPPSGLEAEDESTANEGPSNIRTKSITPDGAESAWQQFNILSLDGGGIRGFWSLLVLERLMSFIAKFEESEEECFHSFFPQKWPEEFCKDTLTVDKRRDYDAAESERDRLLVIPATRRYLPCHYFDFICGTSTGSLIAIMLGRFRMTVPDCMAEYQTLGQEIFGSPRFFRATRFGVGNRCKYNTDTVEKAFKDVASRRQEKQKSQLQGEVTFPSLDGVCSTFVTTRKSEDDGKTDRLVILRSYDHIEMRSPHSATNSMNPTWKTGRTNTGQLTNASTNSQAKPQKWRVKTINYGDADQIRIWEVARAATAAKFYFEPLKMRRRDPPGYTVFVDGGLSQDNNPTTLARKEVESLKRTGSIGTIVSVGTARKQKEDKSKGFFTAFPRTMKKWAHDMTDPEKVHQEMRENNESAEGGYYRLNYPGLLDVELDEWKPKQRPFHRTTPGSATIDRIKQAFDTWLAAPSTENEASAHDMLTECAIRLVDKRKKRMGAREWERFAIGVQYRCRFEGCNVKEISSIETFKAHLKDDHMVQDHLLDKEAKDTIVRSRWRYQTKVDYSGRRDSMKNR